MTPMHDYYSAIAVWLWHDAPPWFQRLSEHGGDEDFVIYVPPELCIRLEGDDKLIPDETVRVLVDRIAGPLWETDEHTWHQLANGGLVVITAHA